MEISQLQTAWSTTKTSPAEVPASPLRPQPSDSRNEARFQPGTLLANRYRIVGLVGKGGMGEVHRAYDLMLEQPVALKFLPESSAANPEAMARFRNEVRIARQVSHPNVCRVYDIGEVQGHTYLSMEYVDGEDLSCLLRRIGRMPAEKGVEIARRLCAGLAAAHARGVLHRDLKPSNVMIDGHGQVLITDFGLACFAEQLLSAEVCHGTPCYMAPEQLSGKGVSVRSDIYSLGLLLYEMFTGRRVFHANSMAELLRQHQSLLLVNPTFLAKDLDPAVERLIMSCLDSDPYNRPQSALAVSAGLPGGDPLAAALAAGETPSPDMVAAASETRGLPSRVAGWCMASVVVGLVGVAFLSDKVNLTERELLERTPEVLTQKARDIIQGFGYAYRPADAAYGFRYDADRYLRYVQKQGPSPKRFSRLAGHQPPLITFWYCQSPRYLDPSSLLARNFGPMRIMSVAATVDAFDSPPGPPGQVRVQLDPLGRLIYLSAVPKVAESPDRSGPFDWNQLLIAAGLDRAALSPMEPQWTPPGAFDTRAGWSGTYTEPPGFSIHVEAAAWHGRPVFFQITGPWDNPGAATSIRPEEVAAFTVWYAIAFSIVVGASFLARHNIRAGRSDRRGSLRLAAFVFFAYMLTWSAMSHHVPTETELTMFMTAIGQSACLSGGLWLIYTALEPYVRRRWPQAIISWSRILAGAAWDRLVGADLLRGVIAGIAWTLVMQSHEIARLSLGETAWWKPSLYTLLGVRQSFGQLVLYLPQSIVNALAILFSILVLRILVPRQWLADAIYVALFTLQMFGSTEGASRLWLGVPVWTLIFGSIIFVLMRFGLVTLTTGFFVLYILRSYPITANLSAWYADSSLFVLAIVFALSAYGFYAVVKQGPFLKDAMLHKP